LIKSHPLEWREPMRRNNCLFSSKKTTTFLNGTQVIR
jgi:hypothetical protein